MEISRKPSKYLPCCYLFILIMYLIIQYFMISTHLIYSPRPQSIFIIYIRPISCNLPYRILYSLYFTVTVKYKEDRILFWRFITWNWPYIYITNNSLVGYAHSFVSKVLRLVKKKTVRRTFYEVIYLYDWLWNLVFLMQINSWKYQWKSNNWVQSVCFQSRSLQINWSIDRPLLFDDSKFEQQVSSK